MDLKFKKIKRKPLYVYMAKVDAKSAKELLKRGYNNQKQRHTINFVSMIL